MSLCKYHYSIKSFLSVIHLIAFAVFFLVMIGCVFREVNERYHYNILIDQMQKVNVKVDLPIPSMSQESVDFAIAFYTIYGGVNVKSMKYDPALYDRGLTLGTLFRSQKYVTVGPSSFTSWGMLGSTLAHETEIHGTQSFLGIILADMVGKLRFLFQWTMAAQTSQEQKECVNDLGTWYAERIAYGYEIKQRNRFGLSQMEIDSIVEVRDFYYPDKFSLWCKKPW